ncbi:Crp/Fnr family transcriptional regulator [bacterium]|nr:Crp/Fnr family transcriptional regulator [bacterium]
MNRLFDHINSRINISKSEFDVVSQKLREVKFKKKEIIIRPNQLAPFHFFVLNGCLRSYFIDSTGKEHTVSFAIEDWFIGDYISYFGGEKSILYVQCIEDCHLVRIDKDVWESLYHEIPQIESYTRINLERSFGASQRKTINNLSLSAKQRYSNFRITYLDIEQRVKNYHIASYLGIARESLSRVRKDYLRG